jgi:hypothetical protein
LDKLRSYCGTRRSGRKGALPPVQLQVLTMLSGLAPEGP